MSLKAIESKVPAVTLGFWIVKILATTLGETGGDFFDKPLKQGGLGVGRPLATAIIAVVIAGCILILPQRPGLHPAVAKSDCA